MYFNIIKYVSELHTTAALYGSPTVTNVTGNFSLSKHCFFLFAHSELSSFASSQT
jgi:hypothetical protein